MNTWPQHEDRHERTIMGARLHDSECLRCHLEAVAAEHAEKQPRKRQNENNRRR
jgi:hypothetical protein